MRTLLLASLLIVMPAGAFAQDPTQPVRAVMAITAANWAGEGGEGGDLFSEQMLNSTYSRDFVAKYREAAKFPPFEESETPFDYDVITNSQDGCALEDISVSAGESRNGVTDVIATFKNMTCFGSEPEYQIPAEVHFDVIEEDGRPVIDDIHARLDGEEPGSLKAEMTVMAGQ